MTFVEKTNPLKASSKNARTKQLLFFCTRNIYLITTNCILIDSYWIWADSAGLLQTSVSSLALLLSAESSQGHIRTALFSKASILFNLVP